MTLYRAAVVAALAVMAGALDILPMQVATADSSPSIAVVIPSNGATLSGTSQLLDAVPPTGTTQVQFEITGGTLSDSVIATGTPTLFGWLALWNTTAVPNGGYALQSVASHQGGVGATSPAITIDLDNAPSLHFGHYPHKRFDPRRLRHLVVRCHRFAWRESSPV